MTDQAARFADTVPEYYDRELGPHLFQAYATDLANRVASLDPGRVLELAAGTGIVTRALRDALPASCELVATDLSPSMLDWAREKFEDGEQVHLQPVDAMQLPFEADSFDVVVCQFGVMFFPDKGQSYREVCRVLKPGGHYLFNVWDSWKENAFAQMAHEVVAEFFPQDPPGFYRVPFGYCDTQLIESTLNAAGFSDPAVHLVPTRSQISSAPVLGHGLIYGNPLYDEIVSRGGDHGAICAAMTRAVEANLGTHLSLQAIVFDATLA